MTTKTMTKKLSLDPEDLAMEISKALNTTKSFNYQEMIDYLSEIKAQKWIKTKAKGKYLKEVEDLIKMMKEILTNPNDKDDESIKFGLNLLFLNLSNQFCQDIFGE